MHSQLVSTMITVVRTQMAALDQVLSLLEQSIETKPEAEPDDTLRCPACQTELTPSNEYICMGMDRPQYACPNCEFRGEV